MSDRKPRPRSRDELEIAPEGPHHYDPSFPPYYQSSHHPMATYANYPPPPRQQYPYPYPPYPGHRSDPASSPPEGFHPPLHRYPPRRNPTAVSPESSQAMPAEFMSPPPNMKRRALTPGSSLTPSKRARTGESFLSLLPFSVRESILR